MGYNAVGDGDLDRVFITNAELVDQYIGEKLYAWGSGGSFALGTGNSSNYSSPVNVAGGGTNWKQISSVNARHAAAVKTDGTLWTWGDGYYNNTGGGGSSSPITIAGGGTNWNYTSVGQNSGAAIKTDGTLWTWGVNGAGQLGDGTTSSRNSPVSVLGGINAWKSVSVGGPGTTGGAIGAIKSDNTLWTWGLNALLGDYTTASNRSSPSTVFGPPSFKETSTYTKDVILQNITSPSFVGDVTRSDSTAIYFNGATNLRILNSEQTTPYYGKWTVEGWFNTSTDAGTLYCNGLDPALGGIRILCSTTYGIIAYIGSSTINGPSSQFISGGWNHFAVVSNNGEIRTFVNGVLGSTVTYTGTPLIYVENKFSFIGSTEFNASYFSGYIDQLRVLKGVSKYTTNFTVPLYPFYDLYSTDPYYNNVSLLLKSDGFNGSNNNIILNSSNNISVITRNGNVTQGTFSPFSLDEGKWSNYFDGTGDYLTAPSDSSLNLGTGDFTLEAWVYRTGSTGGSAIINNSLGTGDNNYFYLGYSTANKIYFEIRTSSGSTNTTGDIVGGLNKWVHIAVTRQSGTVRTFVNGVLDKTITITSACTQNLVSVGGFIYPGWSEYFPGYISNVRVVKGTALYTSNFTPSTTPLTAIANTSLLTCQSNRFKDNSINNFTITPTGDVKPSSVTPFSSITDILTTRFNGANFLSLNGPTSLAFGTNEFTIEFWLYINGSQTTVLYDARPTSTNGNYVTLYLQSNQIRFFTASADRITGATLNSGVWYHVALCRNSGSTRLFINGVQSGSTFADTVSYLNPTGRPYIGNGGYSVSYFNGQIYNLRILNGTGIYTGTFTVPQLPLKSIANTALLTCQSSLSDNGPNVLTINNNSYVNLVSVPPILNQQVKSLNFPGNGAYWSYASNAAFNFGTGDFTIEAWVYWIPGGSDGPRVMGRNSLSGSGLNGGAGAWEVAYSNTTNPSTTFVFNYQSSLGTGSASLGTTYQRVWHHIAIVRTSGVIRTYNNGVLITTDSSANAAGNFDCSLLLTLGHGDGVPWHAYVGNLASVRIVKGTAVYTAAFTPSRTVLGAITGTSLLAAQSATGNDQSTNAFATSATNGTISTSTILPYSLTLTEFYTGSSMYFDGNGDYLSYPNTSGDDIYSGDFCIEAWINPATLSGDRCIYATGWPIAVYVLSGTLAAVVKNGVNAADPNLFPGNALSGGAVTANTWTHIAFTRESNTYRIFNNGSLINSYTASSGGPIASTASYFGIGNNAVYSSSFFGYISNLRVVKGQAVYTSNFTVPTLPVTPTANTTLLLNGTNGGIIDATGKNCIETVGNAQISTSVKKYGTGSMYFDGTGDYLVLQNNPDLYAFGTDNFTVEFWVYHNAIGSAETYYGGNPTSTDGAYLAIYKSTTNYINIYVSSANRITGTTALAANTWYHVAVCRSGTSTKLFVNGVQDGSTWSDSTNYLNVANRPVIGTNGYSTAIQNLNGYIDDLRITKGIARYTANFTPPIRSLPNRYCPIDTTYSNVTMQLSTVDSTSNADYSSGWSSVSMGGNHAMAIKQDGSLWGWGSNNRGQLGDSTVTSNIPSLNVYGGSYKQVSCSGTHSAMIKSDGTLWTCGYNTVGQLGDGTLTSRTSPVAVFGGGTNWKQVSATGNYLTNGTTVAVKTDGTLWGWGLGTSGQLGQGNTSNYSSPVQLTLSNVNNWKSVTGGISVLAIGQD